LRAWPGNVRELLHEVRRAAHRALAGASPEDSVTLVEPQHLSSEAGLVIVGIPSETPSGRPKPSRAPTDEEIQKALDDNQGNVRGTARVLGIHRNQLRRWLDKRAPVSGTHETD
jgi:transcriptional regulator with GAF, ATPase, and Fis domain